MSTFTNLMPDRGSRDPVEEDYPLLDSLISDSFLLTPGGQYGGLSDIEYFLLEQYMKKITSGRESRLTDTELQIELLNFEKTLCVEIQHYLALFNYTELIEYLKRKLNRKYILNVLKNSRKPNPNYGGEPNPPVLVGGLTGGKIDEKTADKLTELPAIDRSDEEAIEWGYIISQSSLFNHPRVGEGGGGTMSFLPSKIDNQQDLEKVFFLGENYLPSGQIFPDPYSNVTGGIKFRFLEGAFIRRGQQFNVKNYTSVVEALEKAYIKIPCPQGPITPRSAVIIAGRQLLIQLTSKPQPVRLPDLRPI